MSPAPDCAGDAPRQDMAAADTVAVVLTHRRPRLATDLVRALLDREGFGADRVVLVIDRDGGLDDPALEKRIRTVRLASNRGPAAGFRVGLEAAFSDETTAWAYLCEDDVLLGGLPVPRVADLRVQVERFESRSGQLVGAVVAYGRRFRPGRPGSTLPAVPDRAGPRLQPVDAAAWGATLVSRRVHDAGVRPDDAWFFGFEDFDYFLSMREHGLVLLMDRDSALATMAATSTLEGREASGAGNRPGDDEEPWRAFYFARNYFELARRHGDRRWLAWHLLLSVRRLQLAPGWPTRRAIVAGLVHGLMRHDGRHPRYVREIGELPGTSDIHP